jgi:hypothetical protein
MVIASRVVKLVGRIEGIGEIRNTQYINRECKTPFVSEGQDNIKMDVKDIPCACINLIQLI